MTSYYKNHERRNRFPWSLYHREIMRFIATVVDRRGDLPHVLVVGCGLEPFVYGSVREAVYYGADLDDRVIRECKKIYPDQASRLAVCPNPYELPVEAPFPKSFDVIVAKEVIEHLDEPERWVQLLCSRLSPGGDLVVTTPNYGRFSTLSILEQTVLEWIARRDGFSRNDIHPSKFTRRRLAELDVPRDIALLNIRRTLSGWALLCHWRRR